MSVCEHDSRCPGYGPAHDLKLSREDNGGECNAPPLPGTKRGPSRDRSLPGKARRRARRAAR